MKYLNTSAADISALLVAVRDFLSTWGWTILVDSTGLPTPILEVTNSNSHDFKLSTGITAQTMFGVGAFNDRYLSLSYQKSDVGLAAGYSTFVEANDMAGPYPNIWLFTDDAATYCHIIVQCSNYRYTQMSFGRLDPKGAHAINLPFVCASYYRWWRHTTDLNDNVHHDVESGFHAIGYFGESNLRMGIPDGLLDPALDFTDGNLDIDGAGNVKNTCHRWTQRTISDTSAYLLDFFGTTQNHSHTGGVLISPLPIQIYGTGSVAAYVGDIPGIGLVNMTGLSPGQLLTFAGETWMVFPMKQFGLNENAEGGATPIDQVNSTNHGFAVRKV